MLKPQSLGSVTGKWYSKGLFKRILPFIFLKGIITIIIIIYEDYTNLSRLFQ